MATRYDYSAIAPLGSYAAKLCPVRIQQDVLGPGEPVPVTADARLRMDQGIAFEEAVVERLAEIARPQWVFVDEQNLSGDEARAATAAAIADRAPVIVGANLDADLAEKRAGKPDLLVWHGDGYVPVDVKHHMTLDAYDRGPAVVTSDLADPTPAAALEDVTWQLRKSKADALQLAHYRRMLEATGDSATEPRGGIIGKEGRVVWYRLDEDLWQTPAKSDGKKVKKRTTMEVYDFEFDFRRDIAAVAHDHLAGADRPLVVEPISCSECSTCPWREICNLTLLAGAGDASLLPGVGYRQWRALREIGVTDRAQVAALDADTAMLLASSVDVAKWLEDAATADRETLVEELRPRAKKQIETLQGADLLTAGDVVDRLDPATAGLDKWAAAAIVNAKAATGPEPVYRRPRGNIAVPRADIEIDVDMENTNDGVYQWGVYVTDRAATGLVTEGYQAFITWDPITPESERRLFAEFWNWLREVRTTADDAGYTVAAFCWHENAENTQMMRLTAANDNLRAQVKEFIASEQWTDMRKVFEAGWVTGGSTGLKTIAPLAGFEWEVDDPGGGISMLYHAQAIDVADPESTSARQWLLDYNRGDVEATLAIRDWLETHGASFPEV
ncbi:MAG: TM0106 family RecB-like putative nuclease [bacterium]|nr:TM0106 family RecB-like putative nuclease [bacterium]